MSTFGVDRFELLFSENRDGWLRATRAMSVHGGCLVQTTTHFRGTVSDEDATFSEALTFVPGVMIHTELSGGDVVNRWLGAKDDASEP